MRSTFPREPGSERSAFPRVAEAPAERLRCLVWNGARLTLDGPDRPWAHYAKRALDVAICAAALILLAPLLLAVAAAIAVTSSGPVLFRQERWGSRRRVAPDGTTEWEAHPFRCVKFRTMEARADEAVHVNHVAAFVHGELPRDGDGWAKLDVDPRITRLGRWLRATNLDELPQLFNVLKGEMSLVGPRPVPLYEVECYPAERCLSRLGAKPGITGPWQVHGRSSVTFEEMIEMDLDYVARPSLRRDLGLLALTIPTILQRRRAT